MFTYKTKLVTGAALSFFGGLASGLLGIGGGALLVPIMTLAMTMSIRIATATSMFTMILTSISGVIQHHTLGNTRFEYAIPIALGTVLGAQLGTGNLRLKKTVMQKLEHNLFYANCCQHTNDYEVYLSALPLSLQHIF